MVQNEGMKVMNTYQPEWDIIINKSSTTIQENSTLVVVYSSAINWKWDILIWDKKWYALPSIPNAEKGTIFDKEYNLLASSEVTTTLMISL